MRGFFINGIQHEQGRKDFGFYTQQRGVHDPGEMSQLAQEDEAYRVEVFRTFNGVRISLESENRHVTAELEDKLERKGRGADNYTFQETGDPVLPGEYDNPDNAMAMYAEYALEHGDESGIAMDFDWNSVLEADVESTNDMR
ncbi:hypothetical protein ACK3SF_02895 [Candidatus Nanosalina sp. VS9-1]|uniref:hypothetical protein n=1 Tax=Candidatus Nanosalina sp. VS9-1 TaxID=3388566 RepID=UPI0039E1EDC2